MISVVIPTYNAEATLGHTLTALVPAVVGGIVQEAILVDGGSTDETCAIADAAGTRLIRSKLGRGTQLRAGAAAARGQGSAGAGRGSLPLCPRRRWDTAAHAGIARGAPLLSVRASVRRSRTAHLAQALWRGWRLPADSAHGGRRSRAPAQAAPARDAAIARGDERHTLPQRRVPGAEPAQSFLHAALFPPRAHARARAALWVREKRAALPALHMPHALS